MNANQHPVDQEQRFRELLKLAQTGDKGAYSQFLDGVAALARRYITRRISGSADVDDIVQNSLVSIHKALHTYDPQRPCLPWVMAIIRYRLSDWLRGEYARNHAQFVPIEDVEDFLQAPVTKAPPDYEHLDKAVQGLTPGQRDVIKAMYGEDLSVKETSAVLGLSVSAVKVTAHRAYRALKKKLDDGQ